MQKKFKVWIASDKYGTAIFDMKPELEYDNVGDEYWHSDGFIQIDSSKNLYPEPKQIYIAIEHEKGQRGTSNSKRSHGKRRSKAEGKVKEDKGS